VPTSKQVRDSFIDFFKAKSHQFVPSSPIVPIGDESLLFTNAGMNQFKDIFTGRTQPEYPRVVNSQKCLRVSGKHNDLEEVGKDGYHHTFFEMLGNWSFDDYFKAETIEWAWELVTKVWGISADSLWVTVFAGDKGDNLPRDEEAEKLWKKVTSIQPQRLLTFDRKDNFWEMGDVGPCGPCSEIHVDLGPESCNMKNVKGHKCVVNGDCGRFIEIWNLVFIQFNRSQKGKLTPLKARYIDTGAGLERIVAVLQGKKSDYETDLFTPITNAISDITNHKYTSRPDSKTDTAFRVIADHIRSLVFAITDGVTPSNEGRGYVIRRILRRASRFSRTLDMDKPFIYKLVPVVVDILSNAFAEIKQRADYVSTVIKSEEEAFSKTLDRGIEIFNTTAERAEKTKSKTISGEDAFQLYDTYGFPLDLTELMAAERRLQVDTEIFGKLMEQQRQRARAAQKTNLLEVDASDSELPKTEDWLKYKSDFCQTRILGWIEHGNFKKEGEIQAVSEGLGLVLDKTCFYAEAGGQAGDCGIIESDKGRFIVESTTKIADCVIHQGKVSEGSLAAGQKVKAQVSKDREAIRKNHTATHLLQWALQQVCGENVAQQGSYVGPDYLRFDFTYPKAMTDKQTKKVENLVREKINQNLPVTTSVMPKSEAEQIGAMALFGEKYGSEVRVVAIGADNKDDIQQAFSREFCGGTHVENIGSIGSFKIMKEESVSAGVRRITALTGNALIEFLEQRSNILEHLSTKLKAPAEEIPDRLAKLIKDNKKLSKELKSASKKGGTDVMDEAKKLLEQAEKSGESYLIVGQLSETTIEQGRSAIDMLKKKAKSAAIVIGFADNDKVTLLAGVTDDLVKEGISAGDILRQIAPIVDGGGGGRPQMAQAGGKNPEKLKEALDKALQLVKEKLKNE